MYWGSNDKNVVPFQLYNPVGLVILCDLFDDDGADHATDGTHSIGDAH